MCRLLLYHWSLSCLAAFTILQRRAPPTLMSLNNFFLPGFGISRVVLQRDIKYHLGPDTIVRPYIHQVSQSLLVLGPLQDRLRSHVAGPGWLSHHHSRWATDPGEHLDV